MGVDFGYQSSMEKMISTYDLSKKIILVKKPSREYVISAYKQSKFLVLPSNWELSPLTPLEAFGCKKTVVSTNAHGIPYTISHNENCLLVPPSNPQKLAEAILELINNPSKCSQLAESGFNMVLKNGNIDSMTEGMLSVYEKFVKLKVDKSGDV